MDVTPSNRKPSNLYSSTHHLAFESKKRSVSQFPTKMACHSLILIELGSLPRRKEQKTQEKSTPLSVSSMRSQVLDRAAHRKEERECNRQQ